jgi:hypothetical protein
MKGPGPPTRGTGYFLEDLAQVQRGMMAESLPPSSPRGTTNILQFQGKLEIGISRKCKKPAIFGDFSIILISAVGYLTLRENFFFCYIR